MGLGRVRRVGAAASAEGAAGARRPRVAVVGGGAAGLGCCRALLPWADVVLADAGVEPGGRGGLQVTWPAASEDADADVAAGAAYPRGRAVGFDVGAQYVQSTAGRRSAWDAVLEDAFTEGVLDRWDETRVGSVLAEAPLAGFVPVGDGKRLYRARDRVAGMASLFEFLMEELGPVDDPAEDFDADPARPPALRFMPRTTCTQVLAGETRRWMAELRVRDGGHYFYRVVDVDYVAVCLAAPRAARLLGDSPALAAALRREGGQGGQDGQDEAEGLEAAAGRVDGFACWVLCCAFEGSLDLSSEFDAVALPEPWAHGVSWVANESLKRREDVAADGFERWTVQASPAWSAARRDLPRDAAAEALLAAFLAATAREDAHGRCVRREAVKWAHSFPAGSVRLTQPRDNLEDGGAQCRGFFLDQAAGVGAAGDWIFPSRPGVHHAFTSGHDLGREIAALIQLRAGGAS